MIYSLYPLLKVVSGISLHPIVHEDNIERNLSIKKGMIVSERVMLELGHYIGRQVAHEVIYENCMKAFDEDRPLLDCLLEDQRVTVDVSEAKLREILDPEKYTGSSAKLVDCVLDKYKDFL
ncbi:lyase family protein [Paucilactobacillus nenjiangensis]|uniref:Adenylosuccinate lyase C-terminal domain-containing protein n=1 Tax=Paucilactobacillus nenjiangensis TaxID=1296540 RepID=A0A5P1X0V5_9LACO|nr:hypothetical protein [Paucilactobacillus nenjiangensis]QER67522.1 hypothetical protein F0161_06405 [Paucilactobacillus nenjiangensis]